MQAAEHFAEIVRALKLIRNMSGLVITVPHKFAVIDLADHRFVGR